MKDGQANKAGFKDRLPKHRADADMWKRIEAGLAPASEPSLQEKLPQHAPAAAVWAAIRRKLPPPWYSLRNPYTTGTLVVALLLLSLLFFNPAQTPDEKQPQADKTNTTIRNEQLSDPVDENIVNHHQTISPHAATAPSVHAKNGKAPVSIFSKLPENEAAHSPTPETGAFRPEGETLSNKSLPPPTVALPETPDNLKQPVDQTPKLKPMETKVRPATIALPESRGYPLKFFTKTNPNYFEISAAVIPAVEQHISSINNKPVFSTGAGVSMAFVNNRYILETGVDFRKVSYEDSLQIDYYQYEYLGTVISFSPHAVVNVEPDGDTIINQVYAPQPVDVYDSVLQQNEKPGLIEITGMSIPVSVGYRIADRTNFFADVKIGLDLTVITNKKIPSNLITDENTRQLLINSNLPENYDVKWKYHLAAAFGSRISGRLWLYGEPTLSWYIDGFTNQQYGKLRKPFEAGIRIGLKWRF